MDTVRICDTTLRDGEQAPGVAFSTAQKVAIARLLDGLGVHEIEAGTPVMGGEEAESVARIAAMGLSARVLAWNRGLISDIRASAGCGVSAVAVSLPVSDVMITRKLKRDRAWVLARLSESVGYAKGLGLYVCAGAEDASRAEFSFLVEYAVAARGSGADRLRLADTVGVLDPMGAYGLVKAIRRETGMPVEFHAHNDFGMATANAVSAARAGAEYVSATALGLGERAGNASLEELAMALRHLLGVDTGLRHGFIRPLCEYVSAASGRGIPPAKPVVGGKIFAHESGIHVDGVLKHPPCYEPYDPAEVGLEREIVTGKHSGRRARAHAMSGMARGGPVWLRMTEAQY